MGAHGHPLILWVGIHLPKLAFVQILRLWPPEESSGESSTLPGTVVTVYRKVEPLNSMNGDRRVVFSCLAGICFLT